jgi:putative Ca2+/H+ antiporter (TMEM165/GDT1 family)
MLLGLIVFSVWTAAAAAASAAACIMGIRLQSETHMHSLMGDFIIFASCRDVEFRRRACSPRKDRPICLGEEFGLEYLDQGQGDDSHCAELGFHPSKQSELAVLIGLNLSHIATSLPVVIRRC